MILKLWKPYGITSVRFLKRYQQNNCNIDKITCVGRLDPLAQGLLLVLTNEHTKDMKKYLSTNKIYKFDMILGISTESHDCLSKIDNIQNSNGSFFDKNLLLTKLNEFISTYKIQKFPLVSSFVVKHDSIKKPLWWFYTNGYKDIPLPEKEIKIYNSSVIAIKTEKGDVLSKKFIQKIECINDSCLQKDLKTEVVIEQWKNFSEIKKQDEFVVVSMELNVSSGFYIRRFCHDFGQFINTGGIAFDITRTELQ